MVAEGGRASFGSFRIAILWTLGVTVLIVKNDVCMVNKTMNLFTQRFRSKAPSAAPPSLSRFINFWRIGFHFFSISYCDTVSCGRGYEDIKWRDKFPSSNWLRAGIEGDKKRKR